MSMQINISGHHIELTQPLYDYVHTKMEKLEHHFPNITSLHVVLSVENKIHQKAQGVLNLARGQLVAESESENLYAAIDMLYDKLDKQVRKHKEKLNDHGNKEEPL